MGGHGHFGISDVLGVLIVTGVTIPALTAMRLYITLHGTRSNSNSGKRSRLGVLVIGECFLVVVALLNSAQCVLWGWNSVEELSGRSDYWDEWVPAKRVQYYKRSFWASIFYLCHLWVLKGASLCLYYDLLPTLNEKSRRLLYVTTATTLVSLAGVLLTQMMWCRPSGRNWSLEDDFCSPLTEKDWVITSSWVNIGTDLLISFIPLSIISTLKLTPREKYGFITIYLLGFLSIFASFLRFLALFTYTSRNMPYSFVPTTHRTALWSAIELLVAHACFSIPAFRAFLRRKKSSSPSAPSSGLSSRDVESRNTWRAPTPTGDNVNVNWFDNFSSNPNSPLTGVGREVVFPTRALESVGRGRRVERGYNGGNAWSTLPLRDSDDDDEAGGLVARGSEDSLRGSRRGSEGEGGGGSEGRALGDRVV